MKNRVYHDFLDWGKRLVFSLDFPLGSAIIVMEEEPMAFALRRLAILESHPLRSLSDLTEWSKLRKWVLDNELLDDYRNQDYFLCSREVTQNGFAPKKSSSVFPGLGNTPRLGNLLSRFRAFFK